MSTRTDQPTAQAGDDRFDAIIHAPVRLRLCATLEALGEVEFGQALELLEISKSALSKHVATLIEAGYVEQRRGVRDTRRRVWLRLTAEGQGAYRDHVAALRAIVSPR
jgi:DNA-binding MarR family transcriptional regulator